MGIGMPRFRSDKLFLMDIQHNAQIKQSLIHTLLDEAKRLVELRVDERMRVAVLLDFPTLWNSELLVRVSR